MSRDIADRLRRLIASTGPISVAQYMAEANAHYYATRDPLGAAGDFTTAPEISQMFGELVGLWLADLWLRAGKPPARYLELGPGRGTLAVDALRAMRKAGLEPDVELVETSPALRAVQGRNLPQARFHDALATVPGDKALLVVANEFFDALPVRQLVRTDQGWSELFVAAHENGFARVPGPGLPDAIIPVHLRAAPAGSIVEAVPAAAAIVRDVSQRLIGAGGAALIVDYGHARTGTGDTLQAVAGHAFADPWQQPGGRDLTAHVDFEALGEAARAEGARQFGPVGQGDWLRAMGIDRRGASLAAAAPGRAQEIEVAHHRLTSPDEMGDLFKVAALAAPDWPDPAGFA